MSPDDRRQAILDATLPLVLEHGRSVSTKQIAEACGIAEGTVFRAFASKAELLDTVIKTGLAPGTLESGLRNLSPSGDLTSQVTAIVGVLQTHARTTHRLIALLPPAQASDHHHGMKHSDRRELGERTLAAVQDALAPFADALGVGPQAAAGAILALSFGSTFAAHPAAPAAVAHLLLHGIAARPDREGTSC